MTEEFLQELFFLCLAVIMIGLTILALIAIFSVCFWIIRRIVEIIQGRRTNFIDDF